MCENSDEFSVEELYRKYGPMVFRRCMKLLRDEEMAMDAMQEVFVKVLKKREQLTVEYPSSLLYRIATNTCLNVIRDDKNRKISGDDEVLVNIACYDEESESLFARNLIERIFKDERPSTRVMAVLHYVDGMTLQEVADEVQLSVSGVRKRLREFKSRVKVWRSEDAI